MVQVLMRFVVLLTKYAAQKARMVTTYVVILLIPVVEFMDHIAGVVPQAQRVGVMEVVYDEAQIVNVQRIYNTPVDFCKM